MKFNDFVTNFGAFVKTFEEVGEKAIQDNASIFPAFIREQLDAGIRGDDIELRPNYLNDPFFNEPGQWYNNAKGYMRWKEKLTPPERGQLLYLPPRPVVVPNLRITGAFHESIKAKKIKGGVRIVTEGFTAGPDIEDKYGSIIFKPGTVARTYFISRILLPKLYDNYKRFNL